LGKHSSLALGLELVLAPELAPELALVLGPELALVLGPVQVSELGLVQVSESEKGLEQMPPRQVVRDMLHKHQSNPKL
jgi:hypothetical protein